jgi:hypothetical protein
VRARCASALILVLLATGCAGGKLNNGLFQADVAAGRYEAAMKQLESGKKDDVSILLDRGLVLQALGRYDESNEAFARAENLIADLYTRSVSKEALSLLTNDLAVEYRATGYEHAYIAYYRAWNYLQLGRASDVLVEARAINERLNFRADSCPDRSGACGHDVFLRYFSGLLFEWGGEANDAYVAYKQADLARGTLETSYSTAPPPDLGERLVRLGLRMGFDEEARTFAASYDIDVDAVRRTPGSSVVVLFENGMIARREDTSLTIPIFKGERDEIRRDRDTWARTLSGRAHESYSAGEFEYLLHVARPTLEDRPPIGVRAEFALGPAQSRTQVAAPLAAMAETAFDDAKGGILLRAVARALVKFLASEAAEDKSEVAGILVNLLGAATESADTRSWRSLPHDIQVASLAVEPGGYAGTITVRGRDGQLLSEQTFPDIRVPEGGVALVRFRSGL